MALSNIGREPRREITESIIGIIVFAAGTGIALKLGFWWGAGSKDPGDRALLIFMGFLAVFVGIPVVAIFTHFIGEVLCDALGRFDPRPRRRY